MAYGEHRKGNDTIALAFCGDGATSEGDFHEALNFAAVFKAPVVFLVQNNGFAISVPLARQSAAPTLAHKGVGYGIGSEQVDGNDPVAMLAVMDEAANFVRAGNGPVIVEAHTYRIDAHTNADDATRYRDSSEVEQWLGRDPLAPAGEVPAREGTARRRIVGSPHRGRRGRRIRAACRHERRPAHRPDGPVPVRLRRADPATSRAASAGGSRTGRRVRGELTPCPCSPWPRP